MATTQIEYEGVRVKVNVLAGSVLFTHALLHEWLVEEMRVEDAACFLSFRYKQRPPTEDTYGVDLITSLELVDHQARRGLEATSCNCVPDPTRGIESF